MTDLQIAETPSLNLDPLTGATGAHPVGTGVGAIGGMSAGVAVGAAVGGPLGSAVGGIVGSVAGALAGKGVGEAVNPTAGPIEPAVVAPGNSSLPVDPVAEDLYWQRAFITEPYYDDTLSYDDYGPAYRIGIAHRLGDAGARDWDDSETQLASLWQRHKGLSRLQWKEAREAIHAAWLRVDHALSTKDPYFGNA